MPRDLFDQHSTIVVVGASLAGLRAAETLRSEGFTGRLVLVGGELHLPYDRPPLSKQVLAGTREVDRIQLTTQDKLGVLDLDLRLGRQAIALDIAGRSVELDDGSRLVYDGLVIATGAHPRVLPGTQGLAGVHSLRTVDDCLALASEVTRGTRLVVVGAGFIGAEVAATCFGLGAVVTVLETLPVPLARVLGAEMGTVCGQLHTDHGVELRTGVGVTSIEAETPGGRVGRVVLSDATVVAADVVVVGIGVAPTTAWLEGSGLEVRDGVVADATLHAAERIVVAGDIARWPHSLLGEEVRLEHWTNAAEQGVAAAQNLLAGPDAATPFGSVPYFWSDQYGIKIQMLGRPSSEDDVVVVHGSIESRRFTVIYGRSGRLTGVLGFGQPRQVMGYRRLLEVGTSFDEALAHEVA